MNVNIDIDCSGLTCPIPVIKTRERIAEGGGAFSVLVDNTAPAGADVQTTNVAGGTAGKAELGDTLTLTTTKPIDPNSVLAAWSGATTNVVVRITNGATGNDLLTIRNAANAVQLPLGSIDLGRLDYVTTTVNFGATAVASQMSQAGNTITLTPVSYTHLTLPTTPYV